MSLRAGDLDRVITIERYSKTRDAQNRPIEQWSPVDPDVAASWRRATANERLASGQVSAQVTDVFEIRWTDIIRLTDPKDRLVYQGSSYDIVEATEIGRREGLLIRANARADT